MPSTTGAMSAYHESDELRVDQFFGDTNEVSSDLIYRRGSDQRNSANKDGHTDIPEAAESEHSEDPDARYEDIGIDRKFFSHEYFLQHYDLAPPHGPVQQDDSGIVFHPADTYSVDNFDNLEASSGKEKTVIKPMEKKTVTKRAKKAEEVLEDGGIDSPNSASAIKKGTSKKREKVVGFHEDEDAWFNLFFEKIKGVVANGSHIDIPSGVMIYELFNTFFVGKVLKDADGQSLSPRVARYPGTIYNHIHTRGPRELVDLREEVLSMLEDRTDGQLYVPVITEEEIQQYRSDGTFIVDDPSDKAKNQALALSEKEIWYNKTLRSGVNNKRKLAQSPRSSSKKQQSFPKQASSLT
jgi:hypothetical protein